MTNKPKTLKLGNAMRTVDLHPRADKLLMDADIANDPSEEEQLTAALEDTTGDIQRALGELYHNKNLTHRQRQNHVGDVAEAIKMLVDLIGAKLELIVEAADEESEKDPPRNT